MGTAMNDLQFPSLGFLRAWKARIDAEAARFAKLGFFDATFGVRVAADGGAPERLFVLEFDAYTCKTAREVARDESPPKLDFVLEAPADVWRAMLTSTDASGAIDADHTINTLTHYDRPIRVVAPDPEGHDKLFRFSESVQLAFDLAASVYAAKGAA